MTSKEAKHLRSILRVIQKLAEDKNEKVIAGNAAEALKYVKNASKIDTKTAPK